MPDGTGVVIHMLGFDHGPIHGVVGFQGDGVLEGRGVVVCDDDFVAGMHGGYKSNKKGQDHDADPVL